MTQRDLGRRDFLALSNWGGLVFASGLVGCGGATPDAQAPLPAIKPARDFFFLQLSDTHWGFQGPPNPEAATCLKQTVAAINAVETQPDLIVFTGDLTHKTDDAKERRDRLAQFHEIVSGLRTKRLVFLPGEHDAAADLGAAYQEHFGALYQSFEHGGVRFVALDNASAPGGALGDAQLSWLEKEVAAAPQDAPLVVLAHRPLFDLYPEWEWATTDGARAVELISRHPNATVFYGHIHQEHHHTTGHVAHHSARSLIFPLPVAGSVAKKAPLPWDAQSTDHGLGHRAVRVFGSKTELREVPFHDLQPLACNAPRAEEVKPVLEQRCQSCHARGGSADEHDFSRFESAFNERQSIGRQVAAHAMPPRSHPPLSASESELLLRWARCSG